jgi:hypothetical protein
MTSSQHVYEVRPRRDKRGFDLISDALPFGRLWYKLDYKSLCRPDRFILDVLQNRPASWPHTW